MRFGNVVCPQNPVQVLNEIVQTVGAGRLGGLTVTAQVVPQDVETPVESRDDAVP